MRRVIIRYRVKPDQAERNEALVRAVYEELAEVKPEGLRYATFKLEDGVSFVHIASHEGTNPLPGIEAFKAFQAGIGARLEEKPVSSEMTEVGSYRF